MLTAGMTAADLSALRIIRSLSDKRLGDFGEAICSTVFKTAGAHVIPLSKISVGGAPAAETHNGRTTLPDFDVSLAGGTFYVDCKCKSRVVIFRKTGKRRHGIDRRSHDAYRKASEIFRKRCGLMVVELFDDDGTSWSGALLVDRLDDLGTPYSAIAGTSQEHMVYWDRKAFHDLRNHSPSELLEIANGRGCPCYAGDLERVFCKVTQKEMF